MDLVNEILIKVGQLVAPWINGSNAEFWMNIGLYLLIIGVFILLTVGLIRRKSSMSKRNAIPRGRDGFTLLELLTVMAIIVVLAMMILGGASFAQQKAARDKTLAEIAAISVALESYKVDNGSYPRGLGAETEVVPSHVIDKTSLAVMGYYIAGGSVLKGSPEKNYLEPKDDVLSADTVEIKRLDAQGKEERVQVKYLIDPFGNPYGYSTLGTYNPTFDIWSTAGVKGSDEEDRLKWITNW